MPHSKRSSAEQHIRAALARRGFTRGTIKALMRARQMFVMAAASMIIKLGDSRDARLALQSEIKKRDLLIHELREALRLLQARMSRIDAKHRSRYTPEERFNILVHKETYSLTFDEAAKLFQISAQTIKRWYDEAIKEPTKKTIGSLLKALPPLMRYTAVTRDLVRLMDQMGFGGNERIAQSLARVGIKLSRETVRRYRKQPRPPKPKPEAKTTGRVLRAKRPNHIWMMDITQVPSLFKLFTFKLVVLIDVFSRFPLAAKLFFKEPTARDLSTMIRVASKKYGRPTHYVSDKGSQFKSEHFRTELRRLGIKQRFGAVLKSGSIAIIERLWRTLKDILWLRTLVALTSAELMRRLETGLFYYAAHKPHQGLGGATPVEIYFGLKPAHLKARCPPREYEVTSGKRRDRSPPRIAHLDREHLLPVLIQKKKAA